MPEKEITTLVELCRGGIVNPAAVGWSRRPLHRCEVEGPWGRRKRWHHWSVTSKSEVVSMTLADLDYIGLASVMFLNRETGKATRELTLKPLGLRIPFPSTADLGRVELAHGKRRFVFADDGANISLRVTTPTIEADIAVERPPQHQTLGVAVTWPGSEGKHFAYSSKHTALPARGTVTVHGETRTLAGDALACLDWGRGVWPHRSAWNWASAAGGNIGINFGARWANENAVLVDGTLTKIPDDVAFTWDPRNPRSPWRVHGKDVELTLTPEVVEDVRIPGLGRLCLAFGTFNGTAAGVPIRALFGGAEELSVRW